MNTESGMFQLAVIANEKKLRSREMVERIFKYYENKDVRIVMPAETARLYGKGKHGLPYVERVHVDMALSIGGDGTLLGVCRRFNWNVPVCGINLGTLGFLADIEPEELERRLGEILRGRYQVEQRLLLKGEVRGINGVREVGHGINDVVVSKSVVGRMLDIELRVNGIELMEYRGDGLIVSSATGSTGYSLSAGGSIVNPQVRGIIITPICAHGIVLRSLIVEEGAEIVVKIKGGEGIQIMLDGQANAGMEVGEEVVVRKGQKSAQIVKLAGKDYYEILKAKLLR